MDMYNNDAISNLYAHYTDCLKKNIMYIYEK